jgi:hypothetical protein
MTTSLTSERQACLALAQRTRYAKLQMQAAAHQRELDRREMVFTRYAEPINELPGLTDRQRAALRGYVWRLTGILGKRALERVIWPWQVHNACPIARTPRGKAR